MHKPVKRMMSIKTGKHLYGMAFAVVFVLAGSFGLSSVSAATTAQFYLAPTSATVAVGQSLTVAVRVNPGSTVDTVDVQLGYNPAVLQYASSDSSASPFTTQIVASGGNGTVSLTRTALAPDTVSSDALIANVTFTALKTASASALTLNGNVAYAGEGVASTSSGSSIKVTKAPDTTAPVVTISQPTDGARGTRFTVTAGATDNVKVTGMEVDIDGQAAKTSTSGSISYTWNARSSSVASGQHTVTVTAHDAAGNVGSSTVTVTKP